MATTPGSHGGPTEQGQQDVLFGDVDAPAAAAPELREITREDLVTDLFQRVIDRGRQRVERVERLVQVVDWLAAHTGRHTYATIAGGVDRPLEQVRDDVGILRRAGYINTHQRKGSALTFRMPRERSRRRRG